MKRHLLLVMLAFLGIATRAQTQLSDSQSKEVIDQLTQTATLMQTMQCRFEQEKTSSMLAEPSVS